MNENEERENSGFWLGLFIGGLVGAAAGYLLSSEDKKKALDELKKKGKALLENVGEWKEEMIDKGEEVKKVVEGEIKETMKNLNPKKKGFGKFFFKSGRSLIKK